MFLPKDGIANYADDNTPYSTGNGIHNVIFDLEKALDILSKWFIEHLLIIMINSIKKRKCSNC